MKDALEKMHPDLYWHVTKVEFEKEYTTLLNGITGEKTAYQFAYYVRDLIALIRCGHTAISSPPFTTEIKKNNLPSLPFNVKVIEDKLYIKDNFTEDDSFKTGTEIISINGVKANDLLNEYLPKVQNDGFNKQAEIGWVEFYFKMFTDFKFDFPSSYVMEVRSPNGTLALKNAISLDLPLNELNKDNPSLKIIDSLKTALLTFPTFENETWRTFLDPSFKKIKNKKIENLIIDMRNNLGGRDLYSTNLYAYLSLVPYDWYKRIEMRLDSLNDPFLKYGELDTTQLRPFVGKNYLKKMSNGNYIVDKKAHAITAGAPLRPYGKFNFKGKIFILINERTSSTAAAFCAINHFNKRATIIGRETGGGYCGNTGGMYFILNLPNTKTKVVIPIMRLYNAMDNCESQGGLKPDYEIKPNIADLNQKNDREMDFTLDLIRKQK
ncbi:MAG: S41 family peptidase [Bacteroidota bacterium]